MNYNQYNGNLVPIQDNNKEKMLEIYKEATNDIVSHPLYNKELKTINSWCDDQMLGIILLMNADKK